MIELLEKERRGRAWPGGRTGRIRIVRRASFFFCTLFRQGMTGDSPAKAGSGRWREPAAQGYEDGNSADFQILDNMLAKRVS